MEPVVVGTAIANPGTQYHPHRLVGMIYFVL